MSDKNRVYRLLFAALAMAVCAILLMYGRRAYAQDSVLRLRGESDILTDTQDDPALPVKTSGVRETAGEEDREIYDSFEGDTVREVIAKLRNKMAGDVFIEVRDTQNDIILPAGLPEEIRLSNKNFTMAFVDEDGEMEYAYGIRYKAIPENQEFKEINLKFDVKEEETYPDTKRIFFRRDEKLPFPMEITLFEKEELTDYHIYSGDYTALTPIATEKSAADGYMTFTVEQLEPLIISSTDIETAVQDPIDPPVEKSFLQKLFSGEGDFSLKSPLMLISLLILLIGVVMAVFLYFQKR